MRAARIPGVFRGERVDLQGGEQFSKKISVHYVIHHRKVLGPLAHIMNLSSLSPISLSGEAYFGFF